MSRSINFATVDSEFISALSDLNIALYSLDTLRKDHKSDLEDATSRRDTMAKKRAEYRAENPDVTARFLDDNFDIVSINREIIALNKKYKDDCTPYNDAIKSFRSVYLHDTDLFDDYCNYAETRKVSQFKESIRNFLIAIGATNVESDKALDNFANYLANGFGLKAVNRTNKSGDMVYVKAMSKTAFEKLFYSLLLDTLVSKEIVTVNDDHTVTANVEG